jgi:hypothetical protein
MKGAPPSQTTIIHILNNMRGGPFSFKHGLNLKHFSEICGGITNADHRGIHISLQS